MSESQQRERSYSLETVIFKFLTQPHLLVLVVLIHYDKRLNIFFKVIAAYLHRLVLCVTALYF